MWPNTINNGSILPKNGPTLSPSFKFWSFEVGIDLKDPKQRHFQQGTASKCSISCSGISISIWVCEWTPTILTYVKFLESDMAVEVAVFGYFGAKKVAFLLDFTLIIDCIYGSIVRAT